MIFDKCDVAIIDGEKFMCIISDESIAVLGRIEEIDNGGQSVKYENCAIYSNRISHKDMISGLQRIEDAQGVEKTEFTPEPDYGEYGSM